MNLQILDSYNLGFIMSCSVQIYVVLSATEVWGIFEFTQSEEDAKVRTALENLRYKACTPDDIKFLKTRVAGKGPNKPKLSSKIFKMCLYYYSMECS